MDPNNVIQLYIAENWNKMAQSLSFEFNLIDIPLSVLKQLIESN